MDTGSDSFPIVVLVFLFCYALRTRRGTVFGRDGRRHVRGCMVCSTLHLSLLLESLETCCGTISSGILALANVSMDYEVCCYILL